MSDVATSDICYFMQSINLNLFQNRCLSGQPASQTSDLEWIQTEIASSVSCISYNWWAITLFWRKCTYLVNSCCSTTISKPLNWHRARTQTDQTSELKIGRIPSPIIAYLQAPLGSGQDVDLKYKLYSGEEWNTHACRETHSHWYTCKKTKTDTHTHGETSAHTDWSKNDTFCFLYFKGCVQGRPK